jgi:hypothetical protein
MPGKVFTAPVTYIYKALSYLDNYNFDRLNTMEKIGFQA